MARAPMPAPQPLESPAVRRSALLAKLLEEQRQPVEIKGGYGELAARLLAQGITQWGANKADKAVRTEREQRIAGQSDAARLALARLVGNEPPEAAVSPATTPAPVPMVPPVNNTQEPVQAQTAPAAAVAGSTMPPAAPAGMPGQPVPMADVPPVSPMAQQAAPQPMPQPQAAMPSPSPAAPRNPLGITPGEQDLITRALSSGDPGQIQWAQGVIGEIEMRMAEPAALRGEYQAQNGVGGVFDAVTNTWTPMQGGVPEVARARTVVAGPDDEYGMREGTTYQLSPNGVASVVQAPREGYVRGPDGLRPERGGSEDLPNNPRARFEAITAEQGRLKAVLDQATSLNRNIQAVRAGIRAQNGSGDNAIINGLQRLTDDGVVREGDVALQLRMQGIEGGISGLMGYLRSDGTFSPEIRQQLSRLAEDIYSNQSPLFREQVMGRRDFIERSLGAGAFDDVVPPSVRQAYGWEPAPRPNAPAPRRPAPARQSQPASGNNDPLGLR